MITMEMKYSHNRLDNVLSGIKSLIFPSFNLEPIRLNEVYNDRNKDKDLKKYVKIRSVSTKQQEINTLAIAIEVMER